MYPKFIKRFFDLIITLLLLILLSPLFLLIAMACCIAFNGKVFFIQPRVGKNEQIFNIIKFISMKPPGKNEAEIIEDSLRLTATGKFLRKLSLDELPQLINVLNGEMSLIGPRPLLIKYLPFYSAAEKIRHSVRPGITGLAQVNGRNSLTWDERLKYDISYVQNLSLSLDLKIFLTTIYYFLAAKNVNVDPRSALPDLDVERSKINGDNEMKL